VVSRQSHEVDGKSKERQTIINKSINRVAISLLDGQLRTVTEV
jgi:hypothetical protein